MSDALQILGLRGIRGGYLLWNGCKNKFQEPEKFAHLRPRDDKGRQQAQCKIVSAIDQQAALHSFADERSAFDEEFDADHQAFAADFTDEAEFGGKFDETFAELGTTRADIFEKFVLFNDLEKLEGHGTRQRAAAKSSAMHPGRTARGHLLRGRIAAKRESSSERLGDPNNVWLGGKRLIADNTAAGA